MTAKKVYRDAVKARMDALAVIAEGVGIKDRLVEWEIRAGSPTHNEDWKLLAWNNKQPIEIRFLSNGHLGWTAKEAASTLDHVGRAFTALREIYGTE